MLRDGVEHQALKVDLTKSVPTGKASKSILESNRWKNATFKIMGGEEEITCPIMQASTVNEVRVILAEALGEDPAKLDFFAKVGCQMRRLRNNEQIPSKVLVKGIPNFNRKVERYPHPWVIVGAGHLGLRAALMWQKMGQDFLLFERKAKIGGNAWNGIANKWSKLQSEGAQYQLDWEPYIGADNLLPFNKYSYWPTRDEILGHFHDVCTEYNLWPNFVMSTQVMDMDIVPQPKGDPDRLRSYTLHHTYVGDIFNKSQDDTARALDMLHGKQTDKTVASCVCFFPGALSMPHRKTFPGEEIFGGQVGYGFNDEFNYAATLQQRGIVIGMGAFAVENIRTLMEHNSGKFYVIARHHNLLLPRVLSWYVNQTRAPAPAATVLRAMEPMYKYYGKDPWSYYSVQTNADRSVASIKQYTRWGIGDVYFLGVHYGKVETVEGQVKRLKPRTAVITNGRVIENIDHVIKCLGFDCDFGIDRINHTRRHIGFWPDGDFRRWINSDQSSIDASRFGGTAIAPYAAMQAQWGTHFFQFPQDAWTLLSANVFAENYAKPELGAAAYHYDPRGAAVVQVSYSSAVPGLLDYNTAVDVMKKSSMWAVSPPERFLEECEKDWYHYCRKFKEFGDDRPFPPYPYTLDIVFGLLMDEEEDGIMQMQTRKVVSKDQAKELRATSREAFNKRLEEAKAHRQAREAKKLVMPCMADDPTAKETGHAGDDLQNVLEDTSWWEDKVPEVDEEFGQIFCKRHGEANRKHDAQMVTMEVGRKMQEAQAVLDGPMRAHTAVASLPLRTVLRLRATEPEFDKMAPDRARSINESWLQKANQVRDNLEQQGAAAMAGTRALGDR